MTFKIGINGFGRIGRLALRLIEEYGDMEVVAVNDLTDAKTLAHLLKYDSVYGRFDGEVEVKSEDVIQINGKDIKVYSEKEPRNIPWKDNGVELVLEATGIFKDEEGAGQHLEAGAEKVVVTAPGSDDMKMVVYGVNEGILDGSENIISTASCTTNCLALIAAPLHEEYTIERGLMTTIHAYTNDQNLHDAPHSKLTRARAAAENIVPTSTGAAASIGKVLPELDGKLDGSAQRVPVISGSLTELTVVLEEKVSEKEINELMKSKQNDVFGYTEDPIVSRDTVGIRYGALFDAGQTKIIDAGGKQLVRVVGWYDNEMGYATQMLRTLHHLAEQK